MQLKNESWGEFIIVRVDGRIDAVNAPEFERECLSLVEDGASKMVMELSGIEYISSAGLRSILSVAKILRSNRGEIRFCGLSGMVKEVFTISGFISMFPVFETADEAVAE